MNYAQSCLRHFILRTCLFHFLLIPCFGAFASAAPVAYSKQLQILLKCYERFTQERIPSTDALWIAVKNGTKSGSQACMEVLDRGTLQSDGKVRMINGQSDPVGMKVLKTFGQMTRSYLAYAAPALSHAVGPNDFLNAEIIDFDETVLHHVYSVFKPGEAYSNLVTRKHTLYAERSSVQPRNIVIGGTNQAILGNKLEFWAGDKDCSRVAPGILCMDDTVVPGKLVQWFPRVVKTGLLYGVNIDKQDNVPPYLRAAWSHSVNTHYGAGAIGTQAYLRGNVDVRNGTYVTPDGGLHQSRPFGKNVMSDFLCRAIPALRTSDVSASIDTKSTLAFRHGFTCMGCHLTTDPLVGVIRNLTIATSNRSFPSVAYFSTLPVSQPSAPHPVLAGDANYPRRPTEGELMFRSYDGSLVKVKLNNLNDLGTEIANTNDFYVCAAKRYYHYLTGVDVDLSDPGDINSPALNAEEQLHREQVITLGLELKSSKGQDIKTLIKNIIELSTFTKKGS